MFHLFATGARDTDGVPSMAASKWKAVVDLSGLNLAVSQEAAAVPAGLRTAAATVASSGGRSVTSTNTRNTRSLASTVAVATQSMATPSPPFVTAYGEKDSGWRIRQRGGHEGGRTRGGKEEADPFKEGGFDAQHPWHKEGAHGGINRGWADRRADAAVGEGCDLGDTRRSKRRHLRWSPAGAANAGPGV